VRSGGPLPRALLALLFTVASACGGAGDASWDRPVLRLARGEAPARIAADTRYAVPAHPSVLLFDEKQIHVGAGGAIPLSRGLPDPLRQADRVLVAARVRTVESEAWLDLAPALVAVGQAEGAPRISLAVRAPAHLAGRRVDLLATGYLAPSAGRSTLRSSEIVVPAGAFLELALAVLEPARTLGAVEFTLRACEGVRCRPLLRETLDPEHEPGWLDRRLPVSDLAGTRIVFELETALAEGATGEVSLPVWASPTLYAPKPREGLPRGIVLISIDTLRADHLPSYGHAFDTAPFIEKALAREGVLFEHAVASATTTGPAHMTMFTGLQPSVHGLTDRPSPRPPPLVTLAERLRAHGVKTGAFTEDGPLHAGWGFARGFDSYAENASPNLMLPEGQIGDTFERGAEWLRAHGRKPFFLFLHTFQVHFPYRPPDAYAGLFHRAQPLAPGLPAAYDPALYDREIRYTDDAIAQLFETLESLDLLEQTVVVFTSDHGEEFLEHGFLGHGAHLHPEVLRVPLILRGPGLAHGRRVAEPVGHVDLMPTLLELLGVPVPEGLMGRSLLPWLGATGAPAADPAPLYSEAWYPVAIGPHGASTAVPQPSLSVQIGTGKLVRLQHAEGPESRYFDLSLDPDERTARRAEAVGAADELRALLDGYAERMRELRVAALRGRESFDSGAAVLAEPAVDPAVREKLRALGYVD
jgi:arylsulfatase A-like enzyme